MTKPKDPPSAAQTVTKPPDDIPFRTCHQCHAGYLDAPAGRDAHQAVFGHAPRDSGDSGDTS